MQLKTVLNSIEKHKSFVYGEASSPRFIILFRVPQRLLALGWVEVAATSLLQPLICYADRTGQNRNRLF